MITRSDLDKLAMVCVNCGDPVVDGHHPQGQSHVLSKISVVVVLFVLAGLPVILGAHTFREPGGRPPVEQAGT